MGADNNINSAILNAFDGAINFFTRTKARKLGNIHGPISKAITEGLGVLLGQKGGWAEHDYLLIIGDTDKGGT